MADPDARAGELVARMTLDEKVGLLHSQVGFPLSGETPEGAAGSAGYTPGVPRLGIPAMQETDAGLGIGNPRDVRPGDRATAFPASLMWGATFDRELARRCGAAVGVEARAKGFNILLAGGANLVREPRNGRNFEYVSEDPLLTGVVAGESIAGAQSAGVVCTLKHFALNAQETGRHGISSDIGEAAARASDLLAFELAIEIGRPGAVMTGYNRFNGEHCGESEFLLDTVLKGEWSFPGFVMSDWGATHSTVKAALAGLDRQSGEELDGEVHFGAPLKAAVEAGEVPEGRLDDMVHRILRSLIDAGALDERPTPEIDFEAHTDLALQIAEQGIVLLKNDGVLPLAPGRVAVYGGEADRGVLSGGGSSQVSPPGSIQDDPLPEPEHWVRRTLHPSSPLDALPGAEWEAAGAEVAVVFATQWMREAADASGLSLPGAQDELIREVAARHARTVVVLETGGPVRMPWLDEVDAVVQAWYPGIRGGEAIARVLTGAVNPSGRLPVTFPTGEDQLPRPVLDAGPNVDYDVEGADVGYRWFAREGHAPLFPFGFGLSYTTFEYGPVVVDGATLSVEVTNTGDREGIETPQFYVGGRLAGWARLRLGPGETARATATVDPRIAGEPPYADVRAAPSA
jgi:beta-glucosidase